MFFESSDKIETTMEENIIWTAITAINTVHDSATNSKI